MKRLLFFICTLLCANVLLAQDFWEGDLKYEVIGAGEVEVHDCSYSATSVNIPSSVTSTWNNGSETYSVTRIGYEAFRGCSSLTSVTIPNSVDTIGSNAFYNCSSLTSVTIGNSVTSIGDEAFSGCSSLTSVTIGNSVTSIGYEAFSGCSSLTSVTIPNSVTSIGDEAFSGCSSLTSVTIPNSVTSIGWNAFGSCSNLTTINFNAINCEDFDYSVHPFSNCPITTINIGDSVQRIPNKFAYNLDSLTSITIPNSVTEIGYHAFCGCSSLTSVNIPNSVTTIEDGAFSVCSSLTSIDIPNSVTSIGTWAFWGCSSLTSVNIPNSVTTIGEEAFYNCSSLTSVTIPNSVTSIGSSAFSRCSSLTSVTIPNSVTSIGSYAFYNCSSLTSVTIPNSVTEIGEGAFRGCSSLTTLNYNAINCPNFYDYDDDYDHPFENCPITTINIGDSVQRIPNNFAYNLDSLTSVTIPNSVDTIGSNAFYNCSSLTSVTCLADIPPALGNNVFNNTPSNKILYVNCGLKDDYISSWGNYFNSNNIQEITFDINTYVNNESGGSVAIERNNCSTATLTATANICYQFVRWNDGNTENPRVVYLSNDTSFTAIFDSILFDTIINATINAGETYTEFGFDVNEEGTYTRILITEDGCDSIVTLSLSIIPVFNTELSATICQGQTYTENGFNVSEAGVYTQILTASNGFDSIVTLTLNVNPIFNTELSANICQGQVYNENGFNVSEAGVYTQTLTSANGCDSIVTLTLNVNPVFDTTINATINAGETYAENGFNESEAGTYTQSLTTEFGCDSTITLILSVNSSLLEAEFEEISFFPNPTKDKITFSQAIENVEVIDLTGKVIFTFRNESEINIEQLPAGVYYLRLTNNEKQTLRKLIKE